jgi:multimeric flavodoxin WrbA
MKAVIFSALKPHEDNDIPGLLSSLLAQRGWETQIFHLNEMDIKPCSSCGHCAAKTPGLCSIKDDMDIIFAAWAQCQLMIFCTPVSFGDIIQTLRFSRIDLCL